MHCWLSVMGGFILSSLSGRREIAGSKELGAHFSARCPTFTVLFSSGLAAQENVMELGPSMLFCSLEQRAVLGPLLREGVLMLY